MKRFLLVLPLMTLALLNAVNVTDVRVGSFRGDELLSPGQGNADHTRVIIETDGLADYTESVQGDALVLTLANVSCPPEGPRHPVENGLVERIELTPQSEATVVRVVFTGRLESHETRTFDNPPRLVIDVRGMPASALQQQPVIRSSTADGPTLERLGAPTVHKLDAEEIRDLFPSDAPLYLDLYEVPVANVLRWFSSHCRYDIIAGAGVSGNVSLTLQNQTLAEAFILVLRSQGLAYSRNGNALTVLPAAQVTPAAQTRHAVYLQRIDCLDMKSVLAAHLPEDALILQDRRANRLEVYLPVHCIPVVDSLVQLYDRAPPTYAFAVRPVLLPAKLLASLPWRADGCAVLGAEQWRALAAQAMAQGQSQSFVAPVHEQANVSGIFTKSFKSGLPLVTSSRVALPSGGELSLTPQYTPCAPVMLDYTVSWQRVERSLVATGAQVMGSAPVRAGEVVLLRDPAADSACDDWTRPRPHWVSPRKAVPVLLISPDPVCIAGD